MNTTQFTFIIKKRGISSLIKAKRYHLFNYNLGKRGKNLENF